MCLFRPATNGHCHNDEEPRGTKRHHLPTPCPSPCSSRSPSPRPVTVPVPVPIASICESVATRPKRRYEEAGEGLPPIVSSACHLNINISAHRPDNLLNGGEWDRLSHAIWSKFVNHEQTPETLKRKLRLREVVHNYIRVNK